MEVMHDKALQGENQEMQMIGQKFEGISMKTTEIASGFLKKS